MKGTGKEGGRGRTGEMGKMVEGPCVIFEYCCRSAVIHPDLRGFAEDTHICRHAAQPISSYNMYIIKIFISFLISRSTEKNLKPRFYAIRLFHTKSENVKRKHKSRKF